MVLRNVPQTNTFEQQRQEINELAVDVHNLKTQIDGFSLDDLVDVTASGAAVQQIIKFNGTEWILDTDVTSTSFSVVTNPPLGGGAVTYNNSTAIFTYTPPKLDIFRLKTETLTDIPGVTITSPQANQILQYDGSGWINAGSGGVLDINDIGNVLITNPQNEQVIKYDSANSRWINAADEGGTVINALNDIGNVSDTNTQNNQLLKYNSGAGRWENWTHTFLSSFTETDPVFSAHAASGITTTKINNWNTAHGWGNHAAQGYLLPVLTNLQTDEMLRWNGTNWINEPTSVHLHQFKSDWTEQDTAKPAYILNKPSLSTVATTGSFTDLTNRTLANLSDVSTTAVQNGYILKYNGTSWESTAPVANLQDLTNVTITNPANGQVLKWNGTAWINDTDVTTSGGGGGATVTVSDSTPSSPSNGDLWFKSDEGQLKVYYDDGSGTPSAQWVDSSANAGAGGGGTGSGATVSVADTPPTNPTPQNGDLWYKSNEGRLKVRYHDADSQQWVDAFPILDAPTYGYSISAEQGTGTASKFRLTGTGDVAGTDEIEFKGADGITVERTDANTLTFRQGSGGGGSYSDNDAKDAAAAMFNGGTHQNITFTYNSTTRTMNATAQASGGGGGTTYDLTGTSSTSNEADINLVPASGTTDTITFTGSNGTDVSWDGTNKKISINSTAPVKSDWNATTGLAEILNKPTIPSAYSLPTASATVLGGIKVGSNLTIDANTGVLSAVQGSYTLPTASTTVLGGVKIDGTTITIDGNGVITANAGSTTPSITDLSGQTGILTQNGGQGDLNISGYKGYVLYKITSTHEAWIRIYVDDASRQADDMRSEGTDPTPGGGVIAEVRTSGLNQSVLLTPGVMGFNNDNPRTTTMYTSVVNRSSVTTAVTITLTALKIGE